MYIYLYSYIYIFYNRHLKITNLSTTQKFARMHCKNVIYIYRSFTVETKQLQLAWFSPLFHLSQKSLQQISHFWATRRLDVFG